jgi:transcriptional regulator with XRE-family HTH domain
MEDRDAESIKRNARSFIAEGLAGVRAMITAAQLRAARALAGMDQKALAEKAGVSLPTIQRMEASTGNVRGVVDTLTKIIAALDAAGIELIGENAPSHGTGRGVRLKSPAESK